jgi:hypothetical protein
MKFSFATKMFIAVIIVAAIGTLAVAAFAAPDNGCLHDPEQGWYIPGTTNYYPDETSCLIALQVPTALATLQVTEEPVETAVPTETALPTDVPTEIATELPTQIPSPTATIENIFWPEDTATPVYSTPHPKQGMSCERAWEKITQTAYEREKGVKYFEKHPWCEMWLWNHYSIDFDGYMLVHPLE